LETVFLTPKNLFLCGFRRPKSVVLIIFGVFCEVSVKRSIDSAQTKDISFLETFLFDNFFLGTAVMSNLPTSLRNWTKKPPDKATTNALAADDQSQGSTTGPQDTAVVKFGFQHGMLPIFRQQKPSSRGRNSQGRHFFVAEIDIDWENTPVICLMFFALLQVPRVGRPRRLLNPIHARAQVLFAF
jgi:hypothetical protein